MPRKTLDVRKERVRLSLPKANQTRLVSISRVVVFRPYLPIYTFLRGSRQVERGLLTEMANTFSILINLIILHKNT